MSARSSSADTQQGKVKSSDQHSFDKGKGKATEQTTREVTMAENGSSSEDEIDEVYFRIPS
jgi:hypothetical protein